MWVNQNKAMSTARQTKRVLYWSAVITAYGVCCTQKTTTAMEIQQCGCAPGLVVWVFLIEQSRSWDSDEYQKLK
jgi:hypothetical protein